MSHWNYRVLRNDQSFYAIIEVYYDQHGIPKSWCDPSSLSMWDDYAELKSNVDALVRAFELPVLTVVDGTLVPYTPAE